MDISGGSIFFGLIFVSALYGIISGILFWLNACALVLWVRGQQPEIWKELQKFTRRVYWPGVELLISQQRITGPQVDSYRRRSRRLEIHMWAGLVVCGFLVLVNLLTYGHFG